MNIENVIKNEALASLHTLIKEKNTYMTDLRIINGNKLRNSFKKPAKNLLIIISPILLSLRKKHRL